MLPLTRIKNRDRIEYPVSSLFMQNEPNFRKSQMNVNNVTTKEYEKLDTWSSGKNEPKTNPIKANFKGKKCS